MSATPGYRWLLCMALALPSAATAEVPSVTLARVAQAPAEAWEEFLSASEFDRAYSAYAILDKVGYSPEGVKVEACREHRDGLDEAVRNAPVSVAVLRGAMLCAEAAGEAEKAQNIEEALLALSTEALKKNGRQQPWPKPIRVLGPSDVYALVQMSGLKVSYEYFELLKPERYYPLVVAALDEEQGKEVHLVFDYVDPVATLKNANEFAGYPYYRNLLVDFFLGAQADAKQLGAFDARALAAAAQTSRAEDKVKAVRISAGYGGIQSLRLWITLCATSPFEGCTDGLADTLLGLAEQKQAAPMAMLAFVQAEGIGVKRDSALADQLLSAAMRLWNVEGVAIEYLSLANMTERPKAADRKVLAEAMRKPAVLAVKAAKRVAGKEKELSASELQALAAPGSNGLGTGQAWLSEYWRQLGNENLALASLGLAAEQGDVFAQGTYAFHLLDEGASAAEAEQAQRLMRTAALGGNAAAMRYLSQQEFIRHEWKSSARWLMAAVTTNDSDAMLQLAGLYEEDHQDAGQTAKQAFDWYVLMADSDNIPEARRRAARLAIKGKGTDKDPAKALQWLTKDAEAGDAASQIQLALAYFNGDFGDDQRNKGQVWADRVMASQDIDSKSSYAEWLYHRSGKTEDRARAVRMWQELDKAGDTWAVNNMAWAFCTAAEPAGRDAGRGVELAKAMLEKPDISAAFLDTVAACQAAAGDYPHAVETQRRAIAEFVAYWGPGAEDFDAKEEDGFTSRLKLYQQGKPYIDKRLSESEA
ncbi:tetratricopeptide repeat protein [Pseudoxanthomonas sacheonensis]|uniref:tetratricopeptide repeat protein n=1 Tax=Pseudoxanthomonas sacheonensis TaxID=443615 RepID=UPI0013D816E9|nr:sel1 repeat family protein [Pseudoxanthomonas sacheonensis]KAF1712802.1 hypothetical protein CSC73_00475 [Pseudoxanthomonas sacheonensis]